MNPKYHRKYLLVYALELLLIFATSWKKWVLIKKTFSFPKPTLVISNVKYYAAAQKWIKKNTYFFSSDSISNLVSLVISKIMSQNVS